MEARKKVGLTQREVCSRVEAILGRSAFTVSWLSKVEHGKGALDPEETIALAQVLQIDALVAAKAMSRPEGSNGGASSRRLGRPAALLHRFFLRHPEFGPQVQPLTDLQVQEMFNRHFDLHDIKLGALFGRTNVRDLEIAVNGSNGGTETVRSPLHHVADLFARLRAAGWDDASIVGAWVENVYWFLVEDVREHTRYERALIARIRDFLFNGSRPRSAVGQANGQTVN